MLSKIPDAVVDHFAADPIGPVLNFARAADDANSPVHSAIEEFLAGVDDDQVADAREDPNFQWFASKEKNLDRQARIWVAERMLACGIASRRLEVLRQASISNPPRPYDEPALADLTPDDEHLVPLREFEYDGSRLIRNGHAFLLLCTTDAPNSAYWLLQSCYSEELYEHARVRLDPFLHGPAHSFRAPAYRMLVYGRPLNWHRLENLQESEHGRWSPGVLSHASEFTDFVWKPRGSEAHFVCEEVPTIGRSSYEGGRYFHAVYEQSEAAISHLDAAVRIYGRSEVAERHNTHVRQAGKVGLRRKVLRTDRHVSRSVLSLLCQAFFVWNEDVRRYFEAGCVEPQPASPTDSDICRVGENRRSVSANRLR